jgi:hypothetical protein
MSGHARAVEGGEGISYSSAISRWRCDMALYSVKAVRISKNGEIQAFKGIETNGQNRATIGSERVFSVLEVLGSIAQGDAFDLAFIADNGSIVSGGLIVPDGNGSVREERGGEKRNISDLPRF